MLDLTDLSGPLHPADPVDLPCDDYLDFLQDLEDELLADPQLVRGIGARLLDVLSCWRAGEPATWEEQGALAAAAADLARALYADL